MRSDRRGEHRRCQSCRRAKANVPKAVTPKVAATKPDAATRVYLKYTEPHSYAVMSHTGPYTELATVIGKLAADMDKGGYLQAGPIMTGFISNVETTPAKASSGR